MERSQLLASLHLAIIFSFICVVLLMINTMMYLTDNMLLIYCILNVQYTGSAFPSLLIRSSLLLIIKIAKHNLRTVYAKI